MTRPTPEAPLTYAGDELLASHTYAEPLVAAGVRCHGGFDADGTYRSPRTRNRAPAIAAWEASRHATFGTDPVAAPIETWPDHFPNVDQARFLLRHDMPEPIISTLTRIGTVEGFGGMLRLLPIPDFPSLVGDVEGTATAHLGRGLFEAHARDEAGHEDEAGHDRMWFAARDIAFPGGVTGDMREVMLERMGLSGGGAAPEPGAVQRRLEEARALPADLPLEVDAVLARMIGLLFIEVSAFHAFTWAEAVLADPALADEGLVAGAGEAARLVSYIRADETPHVDYLKLVLSELRDRSWRSASGATYEGTEMIGLLWDKALGESRVARRGDYLELMTREVVHAAADRPDADDVVDEFFALGSVQRLAGGGFVETLRSGEQVELAAA